MTDNQKMLESIYKGAEMGRNSISQLVKTADDVRFRRALEQQQAEYQVILDDAEKLLRAHGHAPEGLNTAAKLSSQVMSSAKTMMDDSVAHMAEMMIQGSTMGVTQISRRMGELTELDGQVHSLSQRLLSTEENNIEQMKQYLN